MGLFDQISEISKSTNPLSAEQLNGVLDQFKSILSEPGLPNAPEVQHALQDFLDQHGHEATAADGAPIPHEIDIQAVQADQAHGQVVEAAPDAQGMMDTQAQMQSTQQVFEQLREMLEQQQQMEHQVIQNMHAHADDAGSNQVAVAEGHAAAAHDATTDSAHATDHSAAVSHDDGSASA